MAGRVPLDLIARIDRYAKAAAMRWRADFAGREDETFR
jgi:hypothetical protein